MDYSEISGLRLEAAQKLNKFRPKNIGQASRISGVNPADISVLLIWLSQHPEKQEKRKEKSCGCLVFTAESGKPSLLLIRNKRAGNISFPKGHVEEGETERQTAERELFEETGVSLKITEPFRTAINYKISADALKDVVYFAALSDRVALTPQEAEISEIFWVELDRVEDMLLYDNEKEVYKKAYSYMKSKYPLLFGDKKKNE